MRPKCHFFDSDEDPQNRHLKATITWKLMSSFTFIASPISITISLISLIAAGFFLPAGLGLFDCDLLSNQV